MALLSPFGNIEVASRAGVSPLGYAATSGNIRMAKLLVTKGADVNRTPSGISRTKPLDFATRCGKIPHSVAGAVAPPALFSRR